VILVDSNVLIDIIEGDDVWCEWSSRELVAASETNDFGITPIVVAEVGPGFPSLEVFYDEMRKLRIAIAPLTDEAAFAAGQAFRRHRRVRAGPKSIVADFLIGAQALVSGATILTRDPTLYAAYFPTVPLICPDKGST
jgi:predicted nucleic acid-binding protein